MKSALSVIFSPVFLCLTSWSPITITPEDRINLTGLSNRIHLIEVTEATLGPANINKGLEMRNMKVVGRIVEYVRGGDEGKNQNSERSFNETEFLVSVHDAEEYRKLHPDNDLGLDVIASKRFQESGIKDCKVGGRYLVIYSRMGMHFVEVSKDNDDWRSRIRPLSEPIGEGHRTESAGMHAAGKSTAVKTQSSRPAAAAARVRPGLEADLKAKGLEFGAPVFIRAFKEEMQLELFVQDSSSKKFVLFRTYPIAKSSGVLGPKLAEGDGQVPEGFYFVPPSAMKPDSTFHLAFNIGYPNAYDRAHGRTGSSIMIHGSFVSIGCLAMTDAKIEEIYTLCAAAHAGGQPYFRVHLFPFRMTPERMAREKGNRWEDFWNNLREGYDWFEKHHTVPEVFVEGKRCKFR